MADEYEFFPQQIFNWVFDKTKKLLGVKVSESILPTGAATENTLSAVKTQTDKLLFNAYSYLETVEGNFSIRIDEVDANTTYLGIAQIGSSESAAVWQIKKIVVSGTVTSILWADGNDNFDNSWSNRATLSYS